MSKTAEFGGADYSSNLNSSVRQRDPRGTLQPARDRPHFFLENPNIQLEMPNFRLGNANFSKFSKLFLGRVSRCFMGLRAEAA
jgi:hypothetical protein